MRRAIAFLILLFSMSHCFASNWAPWWQDKTTKEKIDALVVSAQTLMYAFSSFPEDAQPGEWVIAQAALTKSAMNIIENPNKYIKRIDSLYLLEENLETPFFRILKLILLE